MGLIKPIIITLLSILILAWLVPSISYTNFATLALASLVLTILQKIVRPVLKILFLPINIITLGFFSWVINALILWLAVILVPGFHIDQLVVFGVHLNFFFSLVLTGFLLSLIQAGIDVVF